MDTTPPPKEILRSCQNGLSHGLENLGDRSYIQAGNFAKKFKFLRDLLLPYGASKVGQVDDF